MGVTDLPPNGKRKVTSKGQTTIPEEIREELGIEPGDYIQFVVDGEEIVAKVIDG